MIQMLFHALSLVVANSASQTDSLPLFLPEERVTSCCFHREDSLLVGNAKGELLQFSMKLLNINKRIQLSSASITNISVSTGRQHVVASSGRELFFVDLENGSKQKLRLSAAIMRLTCFPDGKRLLSACADGTIWIHDLVTRKEIACFAVPSFVSPEAGPVDVSVSSDGMRLAAAYGGIKLIPDNEVHIWDTETHQQTSEFGTGFGFVASVTFDPKKPQRLVFPGKRNLLVWDLSKQLGPEALIQLPSHPLEVRFSPSGKDIVATCLDNSIVVIRNNDKTKILRKISGYVVGIDQISVSPQDKFLAVRVFGQVGGIMIWDLPKFEMLSSKVKD